MVLLLLYIRFQGDKDAYSVHLLILLSPGPLLIEGSNILGRYPHINQSNLDNSSQAWPGRILGDS